MESVLGDNHCRLCGREIKNGDWFCGCCGTNKHCRACGREIKSADWFCGYCGTYAFAFGRLKVLRYDGVYVPKPEFEKGIFSRWYLRFYPDGFVIGTIFGSKSDAVATYWGRRSYDGMKGYYSMKGRDIEFACTERWARRFMSAKCGTTDCGSRPSTTSLASSSIGLFPVTKGIKKTRLANQPINDVAVIDTIFCSDRASLGNSSTLRSPYQTSTVSDFIRASTISPIKRLRTEYVFR